MREYCTWQNTDCVIIFGIGHPFGLHWHRSVRSDTQAQVWAREENATLDLLSVGRDLSQAFAKHHQTISDTYSDGDVLALIKT